MQPTKAMLLGTFHFENPGFDMYKPQHKLDMLSEQKQAEIEQVLERLAAFQPTHILIEGRAVFQQKTDAEYQAYLQGEFQLTTNETHQLGFKLARRLGHSGVFCVDAWGRYYDPPLDLEKIAEDRSNSGLIEYLESTDLNPGQRMSDFTNTHHQTHLLDEWAEHFQWLYEEQDKLKSQLSLSEYLIYLNSEAQLLKTHGNYLVQWFKVGQGNEYPGVDYITAWYNRNLRIFANIQRIVTNSPNALVLLIIGAGHLPILRHCVTASPEFELVEVKDYLGL